MIVEINGQNKLTDEVQIKDSIALRPRAQCDGLTAERFGNFKFPATEVNDFRFVEPFERHHRIRTLSLGVSPESYDY